MKLTWNVCLIWMFYFYPNEIKIVSHHAKQLDGWRMANLIEWCMLMLAALIFRMFWLLLFWYKSKNMFCSYMFLERSPVTNLHEVPRLRQRDIQSPCCEHALWWWEYEHISDKSPLTVVCQSFLDGRVGESLWSTGMCWRQPGSHYWHPRRPIISQLHSRVG